MNSASQSLTALLAARPSREKASPTGTMRERIAAALRAARPSAFIIHPDEAYTVFLWEPKDRRDMYEGYADAFLACCDQLGLAVIDERAE